MNKISLFLCRRALILTMPIGTCLLFSACTKSDVKESKKTQAYAEAYTNAYAELKCSNPENLAGKIIGDGHCVSLIKACSGAPLTEFWRAGDFVMSLRSEQIPKGTIIATFKNGRYPNQHGWHAAVYITHNENGIWVWDQWQGTPVHQRLIKIRNDDADPGNSAQHYRIVLTGHSN